MILKSLSGITEAPDFVSNADQCCYGGSSSAFRGLLFPKKRPFSDDTCQVPKIYQKSMHVADAIWYH